MLLSSTSEKPRSWLPGTEVSCFRDHLSICNYSFSVYFLLDIQFVDPIVGSAIAVFLRLRKGIIRLEIERASALFNSQK